MQAEAGFFLLVLSIVTLGFARWVTKQEIALLRAQLENERNAQILKEQELAKTKETNAKRPEAEALPFYIRSDASDKKLEDLMRKAQTEEEYFDEVPGLGRG